jgi:hypothetical protein
MRAARGLAFSAPLGAPRSARTRGCIACGLTFELGCPRRQTALGRGRDDATSPWSGQATAAVAGQLERGVRPRCLGAWVPVGALIAEQAFAARALPGLRWPPTRAS